jgi:hypothetical protein
MAKKEAKLTLFRVDITIHGHDYVVVKDEKAAKACVKENLYDIIRKVVGLGGDALTTPDCIYVPVTSLLDIPKKDRGNALPWFTSVPTENITDDDTVGEIFEKLNKKPEGKDKTHA